MLINSIFLLILGMKANNTTHNMLFCDLIIPILHEKIYITSNIVSAFTKTNSSKSTISFPLPPPDCAWGSSE